MHVNGQGLRDRRWVRCVSGGLSVLELTDYLHLWAVVVDIHLGNEPDKDHLALDARWLLHRQISIQHDGQGIHQNVRPQIDLENVGSAPGQDLHLACHEKMALD